jgi:hypothetical protein
VTTELDLRVNAMAMDLGPTAQFFDRVVPWPKENEPGYVNLHWTFEGEKDGKPATFWGGRAVRNLQDAVNAIVWALGNTATRDIYFCTSLQKEAHEKTDKTGRKYWTPIRNQPNAIGLKSLFLDIDVKEGGYDTLDEAKAAVKKVVDEVPLPSPSCLVHSGGGLHVYWFLADTIDPARWKDRSLRLVGAAETQVRSSLFHRQCTNTSSPANLELQG